MEETKENKISIREATTEEELTRFWEQLYLYFQRDILTGKQIVAFGSFDSPHHKCHTKNNCHPFGVAIIFGGTLPIETERQEVLFTASFRLFSILSRGIFSTRRVAFPALKITVK